ncbi:MAG: TetR family transcriptional regulator [Hymenobacter sp.]|nr:MAG: TetR family transcriptional regulator [Hymenobacter sp.]
MLPTPTPTGLFGAPERARIVAAARALYLQQGIAEVSMADIGRYLRMPEHAVQRWFAGKAPLVEAVVEAHADFIRAELARHQAHCTTAVEELLMLRNWISAEMSVSLSPFFRQLAASYPAGQQRWQAYMASFPVEHLRSNLHRGISQGLYDYQLDVELRVAGWFRQVGALGTPEATGLELSEARRALMADFLASIVTPAGALVARRLQEAAPFY